MSELNQNELFRLSGSSYRVGEMNLDGSASGQQAQQQGAQERQQTQQQGAQEQSQQTQTKAENKASVWWEDSEVKEIAPMLCEVGKSCKGALEGKNIIEDAERIVDAMERRYRAALTEINNSRKHRAAEGMQESYRQFVKGGKGGPGRAPLEIDWGKYDTLRGAGANMEQAAQIMGVGYSTLRRKVKERNK